MHERFAVVFRVGSAQATGALDVEQDRLLLHGLTATEELRVEIPCSELSQVRVGRQPTERLNGYPTLMLDRNGLPSVQVAPLGVALLPEITELLLSLTRPEDGETLLVVVPLKPGCLVRARELLAKGPPVDPASLGLRSHEVYLNEREAVFVFYGSNVRAQVNKAIGHPAVWRAGLAWQRCFAAAPRIFDAVAPPSFDAEPAYRWSEPTPAQSKSPHS
jgi:hypothetical protein